MAAAYAALVSLMQTIEQIQYHPHLPISLDEKQVDSLKNIITFLQDVLERCQRGGEEADALEKLITDAVHAAEDLIEGTLSIRVLMEATFLSKIISFIDFFRRLWRSQSLREKFWYAGFHQCLKQVTETMDIVKKEVMVMEEKMSCIQNLLNLLYKNPSVSAGSSRSASLERNNTMIGFDDALSEIMDKLTGPQPDRQVFSIVGMGGSGKTTLAENTYLRPLIKAHFYIRAWVTVSQQYDRRAVLLDVLLCLNTKKSKEELHQMREDELENMLHKHLFGRRYLIVMDDVWSIEAWEKVQLFFPDNRKGSRIIITTRLESVALQLTGSPGLIKIRFLNEGESWNLLCKIVFGEGGCPLQLEVIGKKIAENCKGLPLSIVVIGGLMAKSKQTREYWQYIADSLNSIVSSEDEERCFKILYTSYKHLPIHLKPCFLYMGVFPYDHPIRVSSLIKLWVAEGFLKPIGEETLEEVAEENLKNLIDRNLVLVHEKGSTGKIKFCKIHDLLRELCLREAGKERFLYVAERHSNISQGGAIPRRLVIHESPGREVLHALQSASCPRSLICNQGVVPLLNPTLLRILKSADRDSHSRVGYAGMTTNHLANLRYLDIISDERLFRFPSSAYLPWNLQTLIVRHALDIFAPPEIWKMPRLRHVEFRMLHLPDPPSSHVDGQNDLVLGNLQTLSNVVNFRCGEEVVKRIPNIKKLRISYQGPFGGSSYCLNNLGRLHKLNSLNCTFPLFVRPSRMELLHNLAFPNSLTKLTLAGTELHWEEMNTRIGSLPLLESLRLRTRSCVGPKWVTVDGKFRSLKFLHLEVLDDLEYWTTDSTHFPNLERLALVSLLKLKKIPLEIGEVPNLESIHVVYCINSAVVSVKDIIEEQELMWKREIQARVLLLEKNEELESLASPKFQVEVSKF